MKSKSKLTIAKTGENAGLPTNLNVPVETLKLAAIFKYNAAIRRHTSLAYKELLIKENVVKAEDSVYIEFEWNKINISINGLITQRWYDQVLIEALTKGFETLTSETSKVVEEYINKINNKE